MAFVRCANLGEFPKGECIMNKTENPATVASGEPSHAKIHELILPKISKKSSKLNRRKAIRLRCLDCSGFSPKDVRECVRERLLNECTLHEFRMGIGKQNARKRDIAIRQYCLDCMCGSRHEVQLCPSSDCPLYRFRNTSAPSQKSNEMAYTAIPRGKNRKGISDYSRAVNHEQQAR